MQRITMWCIAATLALSACSREQAAPEAVAAEPDIAADAASQFDDAASPASNQAAAVEPVSVEPVSHVVEPGTALPEPKAKGEIYPEGAIAAKGKPIDDAILAEADAQMDAERERPANANVSNSADP